MPNDDTRQAVGATPSAMPTPDEQYLLQRGWRKVSPRVAPTPTAVWLDPQTGGPERRQKVLTVKREGATRTIEQTHCQAPSWHYTLAEALEIQRGRDALAK